MRKTYQWPWIDHQRCEPNSIHSTQFSPHLIIINFRCPDVLPQGDPGHLRDSRDQRMDWLRVMEIADLNCVTSMYVLYVKATYKLLRPHSVMFIQKNRTRLDMNVFANKGSPKIETTLQKRYEITDSKRIDALTKSNVWRKSDRMQRRIQDIIEFNNRFLPCRRNIENRIMIIAASMDYMFPVITTSPNICIVWSPLKFVVPNMHSDQLYVNQTYPKLLKHGNFSWTVYRGSSQLEGWIW